MKHILYFINKIGRVILPSVFYVNTYYDGVVSGSIARWISDYEWSILLKDIK